MKYRSAPANHRPNPTLAGRTRHSHQSFYPATQQNTWIIARCLCRAIMANNRVSIGNAANTAALRPCDQVHSTQPPDLTALYRLRTAYREDDPARHRHRHAPPIARRLQALRACPVVSAIGMTIYDTIRSAFTASLTPGESSSFATD
jgi:hypothetical protein